MQNRYFVLQCGNTTETAATSSSVWNNFVETLQAMFDTKQAPYRIVLKLAPVELMTGDHAVTIGVANDRKTAEESWNWLEQNLVPTLASSEQNNEDLTSRWKQVVTLTCSKIETLVSKTVSGTDEAAADDRFRSTARSFRQIFSMKDSERLVNYFACSLGGGFFNQGWMYISEHYLAFYSFVMGVETKVLVELRNISEIRKERSKKNLVPDTIVVVTSDGKELFFSNLLFHRDEAYDCLQLLVNKTLHKMLKTSSRGPTPPDDEIPAVSSPKDSPAKSFTMISTPTLKENLELERLGQLVQTLFSVPEEEMVLQRLRTVLWLERKPEEIFRGDLFLTDHFILFMAVNPSLDASLVLPAGAVRKMEKVYDEGATSSQDSPYIISISTVHHQRIYLSMGADVRQCDRIAFLIKEILQNNVSIAKELIESLPHLPSEALINADKTDFTVKPTTAWQGLGCRFGFPYQEPKRDAVLVKYWLGFFAEYGRNYAMVKSPIFVRLVRAGLPTELRGEVWSICSGALFERLLAPDQYQQLVNSKPDKRTALAVEEIEKDLHR